MSIPDYEYPIEQCDVPEVRRPALAEYRIFRRKVLDYMRGPSDTSVMNKGPDAWGMSEIMHKAFDRLAGNPQKRMRTDTIDLSILSALGGRLAHPAIEKVCTMADRRVAHAERISEGSGPVPVATYNDIDTALQQIVYVANFLSASFFYDAAFGSVVPTPQFDVLDALDQPWVTAENLPALHRHWDELANAMDAWANAAHDEFLPVGARGTKPD